MFRKAVAALLLASLWGGLAFAGSTVNPSIPAAGSPMSSAPIRANFQAAATDINNILGMFPGPSAPSNPTVGQDWLNVGLSPYVWSKWTGGAGGWGQVATINPTTGAIAIALSSGNVVATSPLASAFAGGTVTLSLGYDANFSLSGSNLALTPIASGHLLANAGAGSAEPTDSTLTALLDRVFGSTSAAFVQRGASAWVANVLSGDCTATNAGALTCTKTNGTAFGPGATAANAAALTALINPATASLSGALPAWPGNTTTYFRGDGTYATLNCAALTTPCLTANQTVTLSGDATGSGATAITTVVAKINGVTLGSTTATAGNLLVGSGTQWVTQAVTGAVSLTSGGVTALTSSAFANPTNPGVNLTGANGSATTALRSDVVLILDLTIAPTWTGQHIHNVARTIASATAATLRDVYVQAATTTITGNTGSPITAIDKVYLGQPTLTDASAVTVTDASTLYIDNAPAAAGSVTITNAWALRVGAGNVKFGGHVNIEGVLSAGATGTVNLVFSASPTFTGTVSAAAATLTGTLTTNVTGGGTQCLHVSNTGVVSGTGTDCGSGGGAVSSVTANDTTLTISPTTGAVLAQVNLARANTWTGSVTISSASLITSGNISAAAWTTSGVLLKFAAATFTDTSSSGTVATGYTSAFGADTIAASSSTTFTNYFSLYVADPAAGASVTLTNKWSIGADSLKVGTSNQLTISTAGALTVAGTANFSGTFQIAGNAMTFPAAAATITRTVASGATAMATGAIGSGACTSATTGTATGTLTTDAIAAVFNADPTAVTGYSPTTNGMLTIIAYPTADTVNFKVCNNTGASITPGAVTINWRVTR